MAASRIPKTPKVYFYKNNLRVGVGNAIQRAVDQSLAQLPPRLEELGRALKANSISDDDLLATNMAIARKAQQAMVAGWRSRLPRGGPSYRPESRLTGRLGPALADPAMIDATTHRTISFMNSKVLNRQARHWYRVNYGAMGPSHQGGASAQTFVVPMGGHPLLTLRDTSAPAERSYLPRSYYWKGGQLAVLSGPAVAGFGSRASYFTDLGFEAIVTAFPAAYDELFEKFAEAQADLVKKAFKGKRLTGKAVIQVTTER